MASYIERRKFLATLGGAAVSWPLAARAQQAERARRVGVLIPLAPDDPVVEARKPVFEQSLRQLGWTVGANLSIEYRLAGGDAESIRGHAAELVALAPDVIVTSGGVTPAPLLQATRTIPIVMVNVPDPVGTGWVQSLARPGGNATGFTNFEYSLGGKWVEFLKQIAPGIARAAVLRGTTVAGIGQFAAVQSGAHSLGVELVPVGVHDTTEMERGVAAFARSGLCHSDMCYPFRRKHGKHQAVKRREFITLLGGAAAWPLAARAQQPATPVVGFLRSTTAAGSVHLVGAFRQGLNEAGFIEGQNVAVEYRWADDQADRIPGMAAELVRRQVAVIVANGIAVPAVKTATTTIPIVFTTGFDPVRTGLVASLSRPGGNVTGVVFTTTDLAAKQLGLLHELVPKTAIIAVLGDPNQPELEAELREIEAASRAIGREILIVKAATEGELNAAFATVVQGGARALLVRGSPLFNTRRRQLVALAARHALLASYASRDYPEVGGLMSYGPSIPDAYRRAGIYVGRILKGTKPVDLPVEMAMKFDLVINLATAKAIDLDVPPTLLARADEVIE